MQILSEAEIKEFLEGNVESLRTNDYLDTSELIQSIPYNPKFEIPKEMIHIGTYLTFYFCLAFLNNIIFNEDEKNGHVVILGSGAFGQVLKGSVQLLDNGNNKTALKGMNSIDVAVKTVKHDMEMLYFKTLLSEVKIMAHIGKHPNIASLVACNTQNIRKRKLLIVHILWILKNDSFSLMLYRGNIYCG